MYHIYSETFAWEFRSPENSKRSRLLKSQSSCWGFPLYTTDMVLFLQYTATRQTLSVGEHGWIFQYLIILMYIRKMFIGGLSNLLLQRYYCLGKISLKRGTLLHAEPSENVLGGSFRLPLAEGHDWWLKGGRPGILTTLKSRRIILSKIPMMLTWETG